MPKHPFWRGIARLFDFSGELDRELIEQIRANSRKRAERPSAEEALRKSWQSVGDSMRWAIGEYEKEQGIDTQNGDARKSDAEIIREARQEDLMILMGLVEADEERVSAIKRFVDAHWQRALDNYNKIGNEIDRA